jgi:hypothetical protein
MWSRSAKVGVLFVVLVAALPSAAGAQPREGFWFGAGGGYGSAGVACDECDADSRQPGGVGYLRGGWTLNPRTLVGIDLDLWNKTAREGDVEMTLNLYSFTGSLTFYPAAASGFFVKAGAGVSTIDVDVDFDGSTVSADLGKGFGFTAGAGYDIRLHRMFSVTPAVNYWYGRPGDLRFASEALFTNWRQNVLEFTIGITFH